MAVLWRSNINANQIHRVQGQLQGIQQEGNGDEDIEPEVTVESKLPKHDSKLSKQHMSKRFKHSSKLPQHTKPPYESSVHQNEIQSGDTNCNSRVYSDWQILRELRLANWGILNGHIEVSDNHILITNAVLIP